MQSRASTASHHVIVCKRTTPQHPSIAVVGTASLVRTIPLLPNILIRGQTNVAKLKIAMPARHMVTPFRFLYVELAPRTALAYLPHHLRRQLDIATIIGGAFRAFLILLTRLAGMPRHLVFKARP